MKVLYQELLQLENLYPIWMDTQIFGDPKNNKQHLNSAVAHEPQNLSVAVINKEWYRIWRETIYGKLVGRVRIKAQIHDSLHSSTEHCQMLRRLFP